MPARSCLHAREHDAPVERGAKVPRVSECAIAGMVADGISKAEGEREEAMSKDAKLPALDDRNMQDLLMGDSHPAYAERCVQLLGALAQIAALTARVAILNEQTASLTNLRMAYAEAVIAKDRAESELAATKQVMSINRDERNQDLESIGIPLCPKHNSYCAPHVSRWLRAKLAELAALQEGATVKYEVRLGNPYWSNGILADVGTLEKARAIRKDSMERGAGAVNIVEVIAIERILDTTGGGK